MKDSQLLKKKQTKIIKKAKPSRKFIQRKAEPAKNPPSASARSSIGSAVSRFFKKYEADLQFILIPLIFAVIFAILALVNSNISRTIEQNKLAAGGITKISDYPFVQKVQIPEISAKAAIVTDADSQIALFAKNPTVRFSMASTTKIMTALTAFDYYENDSILTVKSTGVEGSVLGLVPGERIYFKDLLYAMLLPSANDAAYAIADNYPGGVEAFVAKMNEKAAKLHLSYTHFSDPTGIDDDGNYTTAFDLARLASVAVKNKTFAEITATKYKIITTLDNKQYPLSNLNKLLGVDGVNGMKTGTTEAAKEVLVTSAFQNGHTFIIVVMNSEQRFVDTKTLLSFIVQNVQYISPYVKSAGISGELE